MKSSHIIPAGQTHNLTEINELDSADKCNSFKSLAIKLSVVPRKPIKVSILDEGIFYDRHGEGY